MVGTRSVPGTEQGLAIGAGGLVLRVALEVEEGGGVQEEVGEGEGDGIGDPVALVRSGAGIGRGGAGLAEPADEGFKIGNRGVLVAGER